jgi:hypothetical protein
VLADENSLAPPEPKEAAGPTMAFQRVPVARFRLVVHQPDSVAGVAMTECSMEFRGERCGSRSGGDNIRESTDLTEIIAPATEGEDLSHCGILLLVAVV